MLAFSQFLKDIFRFIIPDEYMDYCSATTGKFVIHLKMQMRAGIEEEISNMERLISKSHQAGRSLFVVVTAGHKQ
jgi:hypothetical protein